MGGAAVNFEQIKEAYDLVVIGGGITGAGLFHQAVDMGFKALLVESRDFAWGTSSRSSKMVHGGLRYLKEGKFLLTRSAVMERQRLLRAYPGLVMPQEFIMPIYKDLGPSKNLIKAGLSIYSLMAGERQHQTFDRRWALTAIPGIRSDNLSSAVGFKDAQVDDARLVLRLIFDACDAGGHALNYTKALDIGRDGKGRVRTVTVRETETGKEKEIQTRVVINATGAFADTFHSSPSKGFHIRPLRGSHLIFPGSFCDLDRVISFIHPRDNRPVFLFPWEGCLVLGTTDVDFKGDMEMEPGITREEQEYLMEGIGFILPGLDFLPDHALSSISGVRPVLSKKKKAASKESREHVVWKDKGLVTVTGGKLTTFRLLARDALKAAGPYLPVLARVQKKAAPNLVSTGLPLRIQGRYGNQAGALSGLEPIESTLSLWSELEHAARNEAVKHLSDLMLRRVRIGLLLPRGGMDIMDQIQERVSPFLEWDKARWEQEILDYDSLWKRSYSPAPWEV